MQRRLHALSVQEVLAILGRRQRAGVIAASESVAQASEGAICKVAQWSRDEAGKRGKLGPGRVEFAEAGEHGIRAHEEAHKRAYERARRQPGNRCGRGRDNHGCEKRGRENHGRENQDRGGSNGKARFCADRGEQLDDCGGLRGEEAQAIASITAQEPAHRSVAEGAASVEDHQQAVFDLFRQRVHLLQDGRGGGHDAISAGSILRGVQFQTERADCVRSAKRQA